MIFKDPWILILIPFIVGFFLYFSRKRKSASFRFPTTDLLKGINVSVKTRFYALFPYIRLVVLMLFVFALAGPRLVKEETKYKTEGIDIVLAVDASGSMYAEDFELNGKRANRLQVVKDVVKKFIDNRKNDRIGLIAFAGLAYTACPLTTDHDKSRPGHRKKTSF